MSPRTTLRREVAIPSRRRRPRDFAPVGRDRVRGSRSSGDWDDKHGGDCLLPDGLRGRAIGGVDTPPPPSASPVTKFVAPKETRLENGLRVIVVERRIYRSLGQVLIVSGARRGRSSGIGRDGDADPRAPDQGNRNHDCASDCQRSQSLGGSIGSGAGRETSAAYVQVLSGKAETALRFLADVVQHPAFRQEEINRLEDPASGLLAGCCAAVLVARTFCYERVVFGSGAYGHEVGGTLKRCRRSPATRSSGFTSGITCRTTQPSFWRATLRWSRRRHSPENFLATEKRRTFA